MADCLEMLVSRLLLLSAMQQQQQATSTPPPVSLANVGAASLSRAAATVQGPI